MQDHASNQRSLTYDAENRLTAMSGGVTASYTYDGDGNRVKAVIGSSTTVYVGAIYEQTTSGGSTTIAKFYQAGGQRIALRVNGAVRWLATDHPSAGDLQSPLRAGLGSTAVTLHSSGNCTTEPRPYPYAATRDYLPSLREMRVWYIRDQIS